MKTKLWKTRATLATGVLLLGVFAAQSGPGPGEFALQKDGYIRDWLMLAPIQMAADSDGSEVIGKSQIPEEGKLKPKAGDKANR